MTSKDTDWHIPVLDSEIVQNLAVENGSRVVDATLGDGGHTKMLCEVSGPETVFIGLDADKKQINRAKRRLSGLSCRVNFIESNFRFISQVCLEAGFPEVDRVLFDLGWSLNQMEGSGRGFSVRKDEPLKMSYFEDGNREGEVSAYEVVNNWDEPALQAIIRGYGEERFASRIAKAIVERREEETIESSGDLVDVVKTATPGWYHRKRLHPATRTFQAIRMAVNDEIQALQEGLEGAMSLLSPGGLIAVISFHSLEDREVKRRFRGWKKLGYGEIKTSKPIGPSDQEREENPRSRSAKLRVFQKNKI